MQNELKTAIRFENFWEAFGPRGVIALAWWMGARHAEAIREEQMSFPILHIEGAAASGKSTLQTYLWKLLGQDNFSECDPYRATRWGVYARSPTPAMALRVSTVNLRTLTLTLIGMSFDRCSTVEMLSTAARKVSKTSRSVAP
ncbi:hypothetical protein [Pseudomonas sp. S11A4]|uniref:hypothetical protein n=1 Tax=Pseudomonas sp. S11A4 TaxID=1476791 RepID=UPI00215C6835|nr:hypothetical protein [Pseudomonas sp. S11A4]MCR8935661.1 hypothetical protein [Pseudomonas sp. S11A4]